MIMNFLILVGAVLLALLVNSYIGVSKILAPKATA